MRVLRFLSIFAAVLAFAIGTVNASWAGEHPGHPTKTKNAEHPEHPSKDKVKKAEHPTKVHAPVEVTMQMLGDAIEQWVAFDADLHGGLFQVTDRIDGPLQLSLAKVHRERLSSLGNDVYFACADFKSTTGHIYDLDVFMQPMAGSPFEGLVPTSVSVHKKDGIARYGWAEKDGVWVRTKPKK